MTDSAVLFRRSFEAAALVRAHPPRFVDPNKLAVWERLCAGPAPRGTIEVVRYGDAALPERRPGARPAVVECPGFFEYGEPGPPGTVHWHLNFATTDCFGYYAGPLLAQDELQVLEHPALASIREAALAEGFSIRCVERGRPAPVLVAGVERRGALDTAPARGRPMGLYGNAFARAPVREVLAALEVLDPPEVTNLVAIEAPAYGSGPYRREELHGILGTAHAGFRAAVLETARHAASAGAAPRTVLHTGFWGSGAYGGDRELMALLQLVAAELAGVDELRFYTARSDGPAVFASARARHAALPAAAPTGELLDRVLELGYVWGAGNGT